MPFCTSLFLRVCTFTTKSVQRYDIFSSFPNFNPNLYTYIIMRARNVQTTSASIPSCRAALPAKSQCVKRFHARGNQRFFLMKKNFFRHRKKIFPLREKNFFAAEKIIFCTGTSPTSAAGLFKSRSTHQKWRYGIIHNPIAPFQRKGTKPSP